MTPPPPTLVWWFFYSLLNVTNPSILEVQTPIYIFLFLDIRSLLFFWGETHHFPGWPTVTLTSGLAIRLKTLMNLKKRLGKTSILAWMELKHRIWKGMRLGLAFFFWVTSGWSFEIGRNGWRWFRGNCNHPWGCSKINVFCYQFKLNGHVIPLMVD